MPQSDPDLSPTSVPLRHLHSPASSIQSSDFDHLLSEDDARSEPDSDDGLPPTDGGRQAWTFLLACWLMEAMVWGFLLGFGVFQSYYVSHPLFKDNAGSIPTIGTLATGVAYLGMPFANVIALRWPQHQRIMCGAGWLMCMIGLVGASFATKAWHLILCQGLLYGAGWVICYTPFLIMLNGWFIKRRGLVYGICFASSGVSGAIIPLAVGASLDRWGFRITLSAYAFATVIISGPGLFFIKPRGPRTADEALRTRKKASEQELKPVLRSNHFILFAAAVFLQGLGYFLPNIFLPSFANDLSLPSSAGSGLLALNCLSQVVGQVGAGFLSDRMNPYITTSLATLFSSLSVLFLWGPAKGMFQLALFSLLWGLFSASYSVLYASICAFLTPDSDLGMTLYGIFSFERGVANILEGPISALLLRQSVDVDSYALGRYQGTVWFTAICMLLASFGVVGFVLPRPRG